MDSRKPPPPLRSSPNSIPLALPPLLPIPPSRNHTPNAQPITYPMHNPDPTLLLALNNLNPPLLLFKNLHSFPSFHSLLSSPHSLSSHLIFFYIPSFFLPSFECTKYISILSTHEPESPSFFLSLFWFCSSMSR